MPFFNYYKCFQNNIKMNMHLQKARYGANLTTEIEGILEMHEW